MLQNPYKTLGIMKNMVHKIPPRGEVNHIQPVAYYLRFHQLSEPITVLLTFTGRLPVDFHCHHFQTSSLLNVRSLPLDTFKVVA